jgi:hypothetical protein
MIEELRLRNSSEETIRSYVASVERFARYYHTSPDQMNAEQVRSYLLYLLKERKLSWPAIHVNAKQHPRRCRRRGSSLRRFYERGNVNNQYYSKTADVRIDHRFSDKDSMFGCFTYNPTTTVYPTLYPQVQYQNIIINPGNGIYPGNSTEDSQAYMVDYIHIVKPTLVMELKSGFTRLNIATLSANQGTNLSDKFGIPGANVNKYVSGLLNVNINGYTGTGSCNTLGDCTSVPIYDINNVFQEEGALTWTHATHNVKFGAGVIRRQMNYYQIQNGTGQFTWSGATAGGPPNSLANFLLGVPTTITRQFPYQFQYYRIWEPHVYVQDDWHITRKLALNIGLRWDHIGQLASATGQRSNYQLDSHSFCIGDYACVQPNWKQFQPRFGYAYSAGKGFVLRGGFGMSYFAQDYASGSLNLANPPFVTVNFTCSPAALTGSSVCPSGVGSLSQGPPPIVAPNVSQLLGPVAGGLNSQLAAHSDYYPGAKVMEFNFTLQKHALTCSPPLMSGNWGVICNTPGTPISLSRPVRPSPRSTYAQSPCPISPTLLSTVLVAPASTTLRSSSSSAAIPRGSRRMRTMSLAAT